MPDTTIIWPVRRDLMATNSILDADMSTVTGWVRSGFAWWLDELRSMMPFLFTRRDRLIANYIYCNGDGSLTLQGRAKPEAVLVDPAMCLVRQIELPVLGDQDLARVVALDADRIMPIPAHQLIVAANADPNDRTRVTVAALRVETLATLLQKVKADGFAVPERIGMFDPVMPGRLAIDFSQGCAAAGLTAPIRPVALGWWAIVGFLFALNVSAMVWRDVESVRKMEALVAAQAPAVNTARTISKKISNTQKSAQLLADRRARQNVMGALAAVTQSLPERAWVQRFSWDGSSLRLSGYKREGTDVIGALRKSPYLKDVRAANTEAMAEVPTGQPFDISATFQAGAT
jgi:hypothetical protein